MFKPFSISGRRGQCYNLVRILGDGAFGTVYLATYADDANKKVAIKEIDMVDDNVCGKVLRETTAMRTLRHKNIISLVEVISENGKIYMVMELLKENLDSYILRCSSVVEVATAKMFFKQILEGLKHMHDARIVHRDLTTANVMVNEEEDGIKIIGFGSSTSINISSRQEYSPTAPTTLFTAPESLDDYNCCSTSIDIWAAGCIFAYLVLGEPLFDEEGEVLRLKAMSIFCEKLSQEPMKNRSKMDSIEEQVWKLVQKVGSQGHELLRGIFCMDKEQRITAEDALDHAYFQPQEL